MSTKYCQDCGAKHEKVANFCTNCGFAFNKAAIASQKPSKSTSVDDVQDDDEDGPVTVPAIDGLQVEIVPFRTNKVKIGEIVGTAQAAEKFERPPAPKVSRKKFLQELQREGGTLREK